MSRYGGEAAVASTWMGVGRKFSVSLCYLLLCMKYEVKWWR